MAEEEVLKTPPAFDATRTLRFLAVETPPRSVSIVVKFLAKQYPIPSKFSHLKRVRQKPYVNSPTKTISASSSAGVDELGSRANSSNLRMQILVMCVKEDCTSEELATSLGTIFPEEIFAHVICHAMVRIPEQCPTTPAEHEIAKTFWPMSFHDVSSTRSRNARNQKRSAVVSNNSFAYGEDPLGSELLRNRCREYMRHSIQAALDAEERTGCIFVDPKTGDIVARSSDPDTTFSKELKGIGQQNVSKMANAMKLRKRLRTPVMKCISSVAASQASTSTRAQAIRRALECADSSSSVSISVSESKPTSSRAPTSEAYLCTGLDAFVTVEPSPMCAMGLLHSRVGRVFYGTSDEKAGVLGSGGRMLHEEKTINHRFQVFRRILEKECTALLNGDMETSHLGTRKREATSSPNGLGTGPLDAVASSRQRLS